MTTNYTLLPNIKHSSGTHLTVDVEGWIIAAKFKGRQDRCFKITSIQASWDLTDDCVDIKPHDNAITVEPQLSVIGTWCDSTGRKWQSRSHWWYDNQGTGKMNFDSMPVQIKVAIYEALEKSVRDFLVKLTGDYKMLSNQRAFRSRILNGNETQEDSDGVFMSTVGLTPGMSKSSPWEGHDVSRWAIARKELGLPKPKRTRKKKTV